MYERFRRIATDTTSSNPSNRHYLIVTSPIPFSDVQNLLIIDPDYRPIAIVHTITQAVQYLIDHRITSARLITPDNLSMLIPLEEDHLSTDDPYPTTGHNGSRRDQAE